MTKKEKIKTLSQDCGTLSVPSKMPCYSWSTPAKACKVGSRLKEVKGSTCSLCYAEKNFYLMPSTRNAMEHRLACLQDLESWKVAIRDLIKLQEKSGYFRWHDSGDIQSVDHLLAIVWIAEELPNIKFWLPTREYKMVSDAHKLLKGKGWPSNLVIRLSALMVDIGPPEKLAQRVGCQTSTVTTKGDHNCIAYLQDGKCLGCRACWKPGNVSYPQH